MSDGMMVFEVDCDETTFPEESILMENVPNITPRDKHITVSECRNYYSV
jgi:hypothetical protein